LVAEPRMISIGSKIPFGSHRLEVADCTLEDAVPFVATVEAEFVVSAAYKAPHSIIKTQSIFMVREELTWLSHRRLAA